MRSPPTIIVKTQCLKTPSLILFQPHFQHRRGDVNRGVVEQRPHRLGTVRFQDSLQAAFEIGILLECPFDGLLRLGVILRILCHAIEQLFDFQLQRSDRLLRFGRGGGRGVADGLAVMLFSGGEPLVREDLLDFGGVAGGTGGSGARPPKFCTAPATSMPVV